MRAKTPCFLKSTAASANRELPAKKYKRSPAFHQTNPRAKINWANYCRRTGGEPARARLRFTVSLRMACYFTVSWTVVLCVRAPPPSFPVNVSVNVPWFTFWAADSVTVDVTGAPCRLSVDGETVHVELGGVPEQLRATEPVKPLTGVMVMV